MCLSFNGDTFKSINFLSHSSGSIPATVINPRGIPDDFFEMNLSASEKLQNVDGVFGCTSKIFIEALLCI